MPGARLVLVAALLAAAAAPAATRAEAAPPEAHRAAAAILVDGRDGEVIFGKDSRERRAVASATKLMTALLALERARPEELFAAPAYRALPVESKIDLRRGERMRVEDLLEALVLESANDAAVTIAAGVSGSRGAFVEQMNDRAAELGLDDTSFANPIGLDHPRNYSSARDLAALSVRLMRDRRFRRIAGMPRAVLESGSRRRVVHNRNELVRRYPFVDGIKTGHTQAAGYVLVGAASGKPGARVVSVVLGEPTEAARDAETLGLLRYGLRQFRRVRALAAGRPVARVRVKHRSERAALVPGRGVTVTARRGERVERRVDAPEELEGPLDAGERVGSVTVLREGEPAARVPLVTAEDVPGGSSFRTPLTFLLGLAMLVAAALVALRLRSRSPRARRHPTGSP